MSDKLNILRQEVLIGTKLSNVDLSCCDLEEFPIELFSLAPSLESLNLSGNQLSKLPEDLSCFTQLRVLFFAQNKFDHIPPQLGKLPNLYMLSFKNNFLRFIDEAALSPSIAWLILTDNELSVIPRSIGRLKHLRKCMLAGNKITHLPDEMMDCRELELLRIAANKLEKLPEWLLNLPKLSWLAFAGNPVKNLVGSGSLASVPEIPASELQLLDQLGEGASGVVYRAKWTRMDSREVAVKLFKGGTTSDGLPQNEMEATAAVGSEHPCFVGPLGRVVDGVGQGLVLPLIPLELFGLLGLPPTFRSVTRDAFPPHRTFSLRLLLSILLQVASACVHLHVVSGVMHGDLYAHNLLCATDGRTLLTDFGAASFTRSCSSSDQQEGPFSLRERGLLQRLEVRALGCLLEDLLDRVEQPLDRPDVAASLRGLQGECLGEEVASRPDFADIHRRLQLIALDNDKTV